MGAIWVDEASLRPAVPPADVMRWPTLDVLRITSRTNRPWWYQHNKKEIKNWEFATRDRGTHDFIIEPFLMLCLMFAHVLWDLLNVTTVRQSLR